MWQNHGEMCCWQHSQELRPAETLQGLGYDTWQGKVFQSFQPCRPASSFLWATDGISRLSEALEVLEEKELVLWLLSPCLLCQQQEEPKPCGHCSTSMCLVDVLCEPFFYFICDSVGKKKRSVLLFSGTSLNSILQITGSKIWSNLNYSY